MITVTLQHSKSTKNTHRYDAVDEDASISSVYIKKTAFQGSTPPAKITLRVD